jgi:hypothetical protein
MNGTGADATYSEWRSKPDSLFRLYREFYVETESVKVIQHEWYGMSVGIRREYDKSGALITETDIEKSYPFSLPELLSALSDRGVDILRKSEDGSIDGSVSRTTNPIPSYIVSYTNNETMRHTVVFDGSTGAVIHEEDTPLNKINVD